jgi:subtilisin-like proprotein convertase family protein
MKVRTRRRILAGVTSFAALAALLAILAAPASATTYSNPTTIDIPGSGTVGIASLYPSQITVASAGIITDVNISLNDLSHTWPDDIDVILVGPGGQKVRIMTDCGGNNTTPVANATLVFDDEAATTVPDSGPIPSSTSTAYKPSFCTPIDGTTSDFSGPAPAPAGPYSSSLATFDGLSPVGTWSLYVYDDGGGDTGLINQGWRLEIITQGPTITSLSPTQAKVGDTVTITGNDFTGATSVTFNGVSAVFNVNSDTQITATVPSGASTGPLQVTTPGGTNSGPTDFVVAHRRSIDLNSGGRRIHGRVRVNDGFGACADTVPVKLYFDGGRGGFHLYAQGDTGPTGKFSASGQGEGRYKALAPKFVTGTGDVCLKTKQIEHT